MQRMFFRVSVVIALSASAAYGQSLAEAARENQEKKAAANAPAPRVITNKDALKDPDANQASNGAPVASNMATNSPTEDLRPGQRAVDGRAMQQKATEQHATDQWRRQILAQKNRVATIQARIDLVNASIRNAYGSAQYDAPYNRYQAREMLHVEQMQLQLDEQKAKLSQMQETARHAGMHTLVYDP
jgi:hypothetical protein